MYDTVMSTQDGTHRDDANSEALSPGSQLLSGQYEIIRYLSSGGFGITYLARDSLNRTVVIKECFPEAFCSRVKKTVQARTSNHVEDFRSTVALFIREAHALSRLDHASVVGVHQVFEDNETAYMALDLVDGKDLLEIIESGTPVMTAAQIQSLTLSLLGAVAHMHNQDLLHRDISPDNILVDTDGRPVLIDFGAAREEASRKSRVLSSVLVVKDGYSPQEFYVAGSQQYPSSDLYALAASLTHLITGDAPPNSQARLAALAANQPDLYAPLCGRFPEFDDAFLAAIDKAMNIVPAERIQTAEDWVLMIDPDKRAELARARARDDDSIKLTISNLIQSMQGDPEAAPTRPARATPARATADAGAAERAPKPVDPKYDEAFFRDLYPVETEDEAATPQIRTSAEPTISPAAAVRNKSWFSRAEQAAGSAGDGAARPKRWARHRKTLQSVGAQEDFDAAVPAGRRVPRSTRVRRLATIPAILFAYFFLGYTALQFDDVHAVTVGQIITMGENYGYWSGDRSYMAGG